MYAMILDENRAFCWTQIADPVRKTDEVLIRVKAAAVNRADLMQKDGCYASPPGWPPWCGLEVSGVVEEAPETSGFKPGDSVCALLGGGGYSEKVCAPAGMVLPAPEGLSFEEAASLPEVWATIYLNLELEAGGLKKTDVFFVQAGASGVGLAAIQFAKTCGAKVITTVGSAEKEEIVRRFGADIVLNHRRDDVQKRLAENPVDVALDCVGGEAMGNCLQNMAFGGRWIMIATLGGSKTQIDLETVWRKRIRLIGSTLRSRTPEEKSRILSALQTRLWPLFNERKLKSLIHGVFPVHDVEKAHQVLRRRENAGKVVLKFS
ncbi:MAG: NAD(P)H-quinone oxidoreductase [Victivallaceae bacterium]|nr:NAD(P)H-quinone oxidoreductase [Victivallaceae bacterium]